MSLVYDCLKGFTIAKAMIIIQIKNYRQKTLLPLFLIEIIKKIGNFKNIFNERNLCWFQVKIESYRRKSKGIFCYNRSGLHHFARNCLLRPRYPKCNGEHPMKDCNIKEKIEDKKCINCKEEGHLAFFLQSCKVIPKTNRSRKEIYSQKIAPKKKEAIKSTEEAKTNPST